MVQINFAQKQVNAKIVYYGPGMSGKTTNLEVIHQRAPEKNRGDLTSISTDGDRTLFFDFMPLDLGTVAGMRTCFQIYTVPGQVYYNSTRKLVLQGVDGVVFVADSSASMVQENLESLRNLEENLNEYGKSLANLPLVIQYNKRDLPDALPVDELHQLLNKGNAPTFEGIANTGQGVFPTLKALAGLVLDQIHQSYGSQDGSPAPENAGGGFGAPAAAPAPAAPMGSTGFFPAGQGAPSQPAPPPAAAVP
ncbi:MAG: ADP-ribosylation factor-like protein, partial [Planctomycetota bacterium]